MTSDSRNENSDKGRKESGERETPDCQTIGARIRSAARAAATIHLIETAENESDTKTMLETS